jgi:hypothetical protein
MKKQIRFLSVIAFCATLAMCVQAQTNTPPEPSTNTPSVQGGIQQIVDAMKSGSTNWWIEAHGLYAPSLPKKWGGGMGLFWNLNPYVYTGVRLDWVNGGFWMPSGNATLQLPIKIFPWLTVAPLGYAGIGVPLAGAKVGNLTIPGTPPRDNNGQPTAILGYGLAVRIANINSNSKWIPKHIDLIGDRETWTGFDGQQWRAGLTGNWTF